jgi:hypothetical protein
MVHTTIIGNPSQSVTLTLAKASSAESHSNLLKQNEGQSPCFAWPSGLKEEATGSPLAGPLGLGLRVRA